MMNGAGTQERRDLDHVPTAWTPAFTVEVPLPPPPSPHPPPTPNLNTIADALIPLISDFKLLPVDQLGFISPS